MNQKSFLLLLCISLFFSSCNKTKKEQLSKLASNTGNTELKYAKGFTIQHFKDYTLVVVLSPWDSTQTLEKYVLVDRNQALPSHLPQGTVVKVPVQKAAMCSSVHEGMWNLLGKIDKINAVCEPKYLRFPEIKKGLAEGKIFDLGIHTAINMERLLAAAPEILVVSPFENSADDRYKSIGIVVVKDASYLESSPLGRSEWIKFEAAFAGESALADKIFSAIEKRYLDLCKQVSQTNSRPTVFTEKKFADSWYIPGGNSYMAQFIKDGGANYLWSDLKNTGSIPLSFEKVYQKAVNADFWLIKYYDLQHDLSYDQLKSEYELYSNFKAFKNKNIFGMNSENTPFYEQGTMEPDVILADMVKIFHPELLPNYKPKYYFQLK